MILVSIPIMQKLRMHIIMEILLFIQCCVIRFFYFLGLTSSADFASPSLSVFEGG